MYSLQRDQLLHTTLDEAWDFFKNPENLNSITPKDLHFRILGGKPEPMFAGQILEYRISIPFLGTRRWVAEIKHVREKHSFVDDQRLGPYSFWYHYHELMEQDGGILMKDRVYYEVPFGPLGKLLHYFLIRRILERIFNYRREKILEFFPMSEIPITHK